jgi:hypothetical protein
MTRESGSGFVVRSLLIRPARAFLFKKSFKHCSFLHRKSFRMKIKREFQPPRGGGGRRARLTFLLLMILLSLALWKRWGGVGDLTFASARTPAGGAVAGVSAEARAPVAGKEKPSPAPRKNLSAEQERFRAQGWEIVEEKAPDSEVIQLEVSALKAKETEFQLQLQSNTYSGQSLERVAEVARVSTDPKTRYVAIESLGRAHEPRAQSLLILLYGQVDRESRSQILELLRPRSLDDPVLEFLLREINRTELSEQEREQAAFPLIAFALTQPSLSEAARLKQELSARMDRAWQKKFDQLFHLVQVGGASGHVH